MNQEIFKNQPSLIEQRNTAPAALQAASTAYNRLIAGRAVTADTGVEYILQEIDGQIEFYSPTHLLLERDDPGYEEGDLTIIKPQSDEEATAYSRLFTGIYEYLEEIKNSEEPALFVRNLMLPNRYQLDGSILKLVNPYPDVVYCDNTEPEHLYAEIQKMALLAVDLTEYDTEQYKPLYHLANKLFSSR